MDKDFLQFLQDVMIMDLETKGPRGIAEANLIKTFDKLHKRLNNKLISHEFTDKLTNEQLNEVAVYLDLMLTGFNTFIEQLESTITKENPHNSGN